MFTMITLGLMASPHHGVNVQAKQQAAGRALLDSIANDGANYFNASLSVAVGLADGKVFASAAYAQLPSNVD